jgi:hypothetical protein
LVVPYDGAAVLNVCRRAGGIADSRDGLEDRQRHETRSALWTVVAHL